MTEIDEIVRRSLLSFAEDALDGSWSGRREREAVSLYVFGHLLREVRPEATLCDPTQFGIEVPVPQLGGGSAQAISGRARTKGQVCKDVVIWPQPRMTCWDQSGDATVPPAAILEWKFDAPGIHVPDVTWLAAFSDIYPSFVGYAVTVNRPGASFRLSCTRIRRSRTEPEWLHVV